MGKLRISSRRARELARSGKPHLAKLARAGAEFEMRHVGASCPACGYVFTRGVLVVDGALPELTTAPNMTRQWTGAATVCTRCKRPLIVAEPGRFRLMDPIEYMQLSHEERRAFEFMRSVAREHMSDQS